MPTMNWEFLLRRPTVDVRRRGRFIVVDLLVPHQVLSTSVRNGGLSQTLRHLVNHQSCEGAAHLERHQVISASLDGYHDLACAEAGVPPETTAMMGTAANMNYAAVDVQSDEGVEVIAIVTAGVEGNATTAGDVATWRETDAGMTKVIYAGTINTMLLVSHPLTPGALARAVVTMTEGKSSALARLAVPSRQGPDIATGTGTDQYAIAGPFDSAQGGPIDLAQRRPLTSASTHVKLGELIGVAARNATMEAVRWQNGLEASYTRGVFHALGRYGLREATFLDDIAPHLAAADLELLKRNLKAATYEPLVGAAAHALAAVCDRVRHGTLPDSVAADARVQQAALLAANLAAKPDSWLEHRAALARHKDADVKTLALAALALGWSAKWRSDSSA
jgi:adenosylcobinamide amidohydrolase